MFGKLTLNSVFTRFRKGLAVGSIWKKIEENPSSWEELFVAQKDHIISARQLLRLFKPIYSTEGSNKWTRETATVAYFRDWIVSVEGQCKHIPAEWQHRGFFCLPENCLLTIIEYPVKKCDCSQQVNKIANGRC